MKKRLKIPNNEIKQLLGGKTANIFNTTYRLSESVDESKGIDGYIGNTPVSIKPETYRSKKSLREKIDVKFIYYKKTKDGITIDLEDLTL